MVPVLVTDDGEVINESQRIVEWAKAHPAPSGVAGGS
jgi:glutathione S-transferase